jgi:hypothetical protein
MNRYNLTCYKQPFILKDGTKVYPKIDTFDEVKGLIAVGITLVVAVIFVLALFMISEKRTQPKGTETRSDLASVQVINSD